MTKFFFKFKKPYFWPISPIFGTKNFFPKNPTLSCACQNSEKPNDLIPRKHWDRQQDGRMDRHYFIGPLQLPMGVQEVQLQ